MPHEAMTLCSSARSTDRRTAFTVLVASVYTTRGSRARSRAKTRRALVRSFGHRRESPTTHACATAPTQSRIPSPSTPILHLAQRAIAPSRGLYFCATITQNGTHDRHLARRKARRRATAPHPGSLCSSGALSAHARSARPRRFQRTTRPQIYTAGSNTCYQPPTDFSATLRTFLPYCFLSVW